MRIHVGRISPALAEDVSSLEDRLAKYGSVQSRIELSKKPLADTYFGYLDMDLDQKQYSALRSALHGTNFRQSKLTIETAKPSYDEKWQASLQASDPSLLNESQTKRLHSTPRLIDVYPGRTREQPRKDLKNMTVRLKRGDRTVKVSCKKTRLWGVEKKGTDELTHEYIDGAWKDASGRTIEIRAADEHDRNKKLLDEVDTAGFLSDSDFESFKERQTRNFDGYDDDDDDMDIEIVSKQDVHTATTSDKEPDNISGGPGGSSQHVAATPAEKSTHSQNMTESLRGALDTQGGFTLFGGPVEEPPQVSEPVITIVEPTRAHFGLFFPHTNSPFLRTQTQASKLTGTFDAEAWASMFWENRGQWNRLLRRRRKDAHKQLRKRR